MAVVGPAVFQRLQLAQQVDDGVLGGVVGEGGGEEAHPPLPRLHQVVFGLGGIEGGLGQLRPGPAQPRYVAVAHPVAPSRPLLIGGRLRRRQGLQIPDLHLHDGVAIEAGAGQEVAVPLHQVGDVGVDLGDAGLLAAAQDGLGAVLPHDDAVAAGDVVHLAVEGGGHIDADEVVAAAGQPVHPPVAAVEDADQGLVQGLGAHLEAVGEQAGYLVGGGQVGDADGGDVTIPSALAGRAVADDGGHGVVQFGVGAGARLTHGSSFGRPTHRFIPSRPKSLAAA